jgi:replicative DNA helicase
MIQKKLIGSILLNPTLFEEVIDMLPSAEYFSNSDLKRIYSEMINIHNEGYMFDMFLLSDRIKEIDGINSSLYLVKLMDDIGIVGDINLYCQEIIDDWKKIQLQGQYFKAIQECKEMIVDFDEIKQINNNVNDILEYGISTDVTFAKTLMDVSQNINSLLNRPLGLTGLDTGLDELNRNTNGLQNTDLIILAGRPAQGKTALSLNLAYNAIKAGKNVFFVSLEMGREQLTQRLISIASGVDFGKLRNGRFDKNDMELVTETINQLSNYNLLIDDKGGLTIQDIFNKARKMNRRKKIDFIIIDYLQLCYTKDRKGRNREQEIAEISRKCKEMAKELNCPILALSQMSRSVEQGNRKPRLSDLRESGAIEQDADMVLFIHHENELNQLIIAKNRNGQIEDLNLKFIPSKQIWTNYDGNFTNSFVNYKPIQTDSPF